MSARRRDPRLHGTGHPETSGVDISSVRFWSQGFDERDAAFEQLRSTAPVSWHPPLETPGYPRSRHGEAGFWAVTTAADIVRVSRDHETFSSATGQVSVRPAPFRIADNMLVMDPPDHSAYRRIVSPFFTPRAVERLRGQIDRRAKQIVARAAVHDEFDFVREVSSQLPLLTIADLLGVPPSETAAFVRAADTYVGSSLAQELPPGLTLEQFFRREVDYLRALVAALAAHRRVNPADDLLTALVSAEVDDRPLSDDQILSTALLLVVAGDDTTKQATSLAVIALDEHPVERAWLHADFAPRIDGALDELLRYASPVISFARTATRDVRLGGGGDELGHAGDAEAGGVTVAAGDKVALFYCSGNRDAAVFGDPGRLDLARDARQHVAFGGGGVHFCLGSVVARAQLAAVLREVHQRMPGLSVGPATYAPGEFVHAVEALPVRVR